MYPIGIVLWISGCLSSLSVARFIDPGFLPKNLSQSTSPSQSHVKKKKKRNLNTSLSSSSSLDDNNNNNNNNINIGLRENNNTTNNIEEGEEVEDGQSVAHHHQHKNHGLLHPDKNKKELVIDIRMEDDDETTTDENETDEEDENSEKENNNKGSVENLVKKEKSFVNKKRSSNNNNSNKFPDKRCFLKNGIIINIRYCSRPPRSSHCSDCDRCVLEFDHHCPWIGNCVGKRNYKYFLYFVWSAVVLTLTTSGFSVLFLVKKSHEIGSFVETIMHAPVQLMLAVFAFLLFWTLIGLGSFHLFLIANNSTTREDLKGEKNPYPKSCFSSFIHFIFRSRGPRFPDTYTIPGVTLEDISIVSYSQDPITSKPTTSITTTNNNNREIKNNILPTNTTTSTTTTTYNNSNNNNNLNQNRKLNFGNAVEISTDEDSTGKHILDTSKRCHMANFLKHHCH
eukprot:gene2747-3413_t